MRLVKLTTLLFVISFVILINICLVSVSKQWEPTTPSGWPEIIINKPQDAISRTMQNGFADYGLLLKKQESGLAVFESSEQKTSFRENLNMEMTQGSYSSLGSYAITRITINFIPVEKGTRIIMAEERVVNPGKESERNLSYKGNKKNFDGGMLILNQLKEELETTTQP